MTTSLVREFINPFNSPTIVKKRREFCGQGFDDIFAELHWIFKLLYSYSHLAQESWLNDSLYE